MIANLKCFLFLPVPRSCIRLLFATLRPPLQRPEAIPALGAAIGVRPNRRLLRGAPETSIVNREVQSTKIQPISLVKESSQPLCQLYPVLLSIECLIYLEENQRY